MTTSFPRIENSASAISKESGMSPALSRSPMVTSKPDQENVEFESDSKLSQVSLSDVQADLEPLNQKLRAHKREVESSVDATSGALIVSVVNSVNGELIFQVPSKDSLRLSERITSMTGLIVDRSE